MTYAELIVEKLGLKLRKNTRSPDDDLAHVVSEVTAWKASTQR